MRLYPALTLTWRAGPAEGGVDEALAALDEFGPTAVDDHEGDGIRVFFSDPKARDAASALASTWPGVTCTAVDVPDDGWAERSQSSLEPVTVGRLTITPPWFDVAALREGAPGPVIIIQPSMGFGTGHHASTRLCLRLLQDVDVRDVEAVDIGTGSGVLAIAARTLGASRVTAIDIDADAVENARENVALNGIDHVTLERRDARALAEGGRTYRLLLANLNAALLRREAESIGALAEPGAATRLIVSGLESHEAATTLEALTLVGWRLERQIEESGWLGVRLTLAPRPAPSTRPAE